MPWARGAPPTAPQHQTPSKAAPQGPQTQPGSCCCNGAGTSGAVHPPSSVSPLVTSDTAHPDCHRSLVVPGSWSSKSPERLIPSTSYRRSLDLVSSWCEAVITLISSGIAFPPRTNFVSTVTSPRGVRVLGARQRQEPWQPNQAPRNRPETRGHPQIQAPWELSQPRSPHAEVQEGPQCFPPSQGVFLLPAASIRLQGRVQRVGAGPEADGAQMLRWI